MSRHLVLLLAALALAAPTPGSAQSTAEREQERVERERESSSATAASALREQAQERAERLREQAEERRERDREREQERRERERESAGVLDTTVTFDARGTVNVSCPGGDVVVTGTDRNQIVVKARTERGAIRFVSSGTTATLEPAANRGCSDAHFELSVPAGVRLVASTWSGSLTVRGVHGDVEAHAQSGDIDVSDAGDNLEVETLSGDITVEGVRGDGEHPLAVGRRHAEPGARRRRRRDGERRDRPAATSCRSRSGRTARAATSTSPARS